MHTLTQGSELEHRTTLRRCEQRRCFRVENMNTRTIMPSRRRNEHTTARPAIKGKPKSTGATFSFSRSLKGHAHCGRNEWPNRRAQRDLVRRLTARGSPIPNHEHRHSAGQDMSASAQSLHAAANHFAFQKPAAGLNAKHGCTHPWALISKKDQVNCREQE